MSNVLSGISITCFTASYAVVLALELSRLFFRAAVRLPVMLAFTVAGLLAHTIYLGSLAVSEAEAGGSVTPLSSWYDWCLLGAWILAAAYLGLIVRRPQNAVGLFVLPLVLALIGLAAWLREATPFPRQEAVTYWGMFHGVVLLLGTVAVMLGSASGVMYLVQSYRLKHRLPPRPGLRLPSLEWLQRFNREALFISTCFLAVGLLSGIALNFVQHARDTQTVSWTDRGVVFSGLLFIWLATTTLFECLYKPARQGRKIAYLTLASFIFLGLAVGFLIMGDHGSGRKTDESDTGLLSQVPFRDLPSHPREAQ